MKIISAEEIYQREPNINKGALGGLFVPGEGILCTFTVPLAFATQAVLNGTELFLNYPVQEIRKAGTMMPGSIAMGDGRMLFVHDISSTRRDCFQTRSMPNLATPISRSRRDAGS